jgi:MFS family permease
MSEGAMENWSVIYLRRELEAPALIGASGVAIFHAAMLAGRLGATRLLAHTERTTVLLGAGAAAAAAMALALLTTWAPLALLGFLGVGLALSVVAPITFSLAGDHAPEGTGQTSAALTTLGYGGFMLGPALIGGVAELASLRVSLGTIVVGGACIVVLAAMLGRQSAGSPR